MGENNHLPVFGVGPYLIFPIFIIAAISIILSYYNVIPTFWLNNEIITIIGALLVILGAVFWLSSVLNSRISKNVKSNNLVTTGIYGIVRHPIYAAFLYAVTGLILISNNFYLFILPPFYWLILTIAMIRTEEKWLADKYGDDYLDYSKKVNRFIPSLRI